MMIRARPAHHLCVHGLGLTQPRQTIWALASQLNHRLLHRSGQRTLDRNRCRQRTNADEYVMELDVWFVTADAPLDTAEDRDAFLQGATDEMDRILSAHDLGIGDVTSRDRRAELGQYADLDVDDLETLCLAAAADESPGRAMRMVVVDWINEGREPCCGGVAPASPGPIKLADAPPSCVVVSYFAYGDSVGEHGGNFLHEGAHFLGLPHLSEFDGANHDVFSDTSIGRSSRL